MATEVMAATVEVGDGAVMNIINPRSDPHPEWAMRYGNDLTSIRFTIAALLASYDYLICSEITMKEATRRLRIMRRARAQLRERP